MWWCAKLQSMCGDGKQTQLLVDLFPWPPSLLEMVICPGITWETMSSFFYKVWKVFGTERNLINSHPRMVHLSIIFETYEKTNWVRVIWFFFFTYGQMPPKRMQQISKGGTNETGYESQVTQQFQMECNLWDLFEAPAIVTDKMPLFPPCLSINGMQGIFRSDSYSGLNFLSTIVLDSLILYSFISCSY